MDTLDRNQYNPATLEKVERLFFLLENLQKHPFLKNHFSLFGGTAINLLMLDVPRLSVDIDIAMIGFESVEDMQNAKPTFEKAIVDIARFDGYDVRPGSPGHAGRTFTLSYSGKYGRDKIKIDSIYMNRLPLLKPKLVKCKIIPEINVPVFENEELIAGKTKAFFDRIKIRDLYDLYNIYNLYGEVCPDNLHKIILFYSCMSSVFPFGFESREKKFMHLSKNINSELYPMIKVGEDLPSLEELIHTAGLFIQNFVLPLNSDEEEFMEKFKDALYEPELLFNDPDITRRAKNSAMAKWKLQNIKRMKN